MADMKKLEELDLNVLAAGLAELVKQQVGGELEVYLDKFERGGRPTFDAHLNITFEVRDKSCLERNTRFFRDRLASSNSEEKPNV